jgi:hypothetical protein
MAVITSKAMLAEKYGFSTDKLRRLMNIDLYDELLLVGYKKNDSILPPIVIEKFIELYGAPTDHLENSEK